jgi:hypothetical protein
LNKYGEPTKPHYHFVFEDDSGISKDGIRKQIIRHSEKLGHKLRGNAMYSLGQDDEVEDINRWLRYCHKQMKEKDKLLKWNKFPLGFSFEEQRKLANEEFKRTSANLVKSREKSVQKETFFEKIKTYLDLKQLKDKKSIFIGITQYYIDNNKPVNVSTIDGYTIAYMVTNKLMSCSDVYEIYSRIK